MQHAACSMLNLILILCALVTKKQDILGTAFAGTYGKKNAVEKFNLHNQKRF